MVKFFIFNDNFRLLGSFDSCLVFYKVKQQLLQNTNITKRIINKLLFYRIRKINI